MSIGRSNDWIYLDTERRVIEKRWQQAVPPASTWRVFHRRMIDVNGRARQGKQSEQEGSRDNRRRIEIRPQTKLPLLRTRDARARSFSLPPIDEQSIDIHARPGPVHALRTDFAV